MEIKEQPIHLKGRICIKLKNIYTGKQRIIKINNLITNSGKESIASGLAGIDLSGEITYMAVGTSATAPSVTNTQLTAELDRKQVSVRSVIANVATFETFFRTDEANGTIQEAGLFGGSATDTANSGTMFTHATTSFTKSSAETMTVTYEVVVG